MKKYTDLFREEKSLDQTAVIELKNTDRDGYFIHREDDRYVVEYGCLPDMCRALASSFRNGTSGKAGDRGKCSFSDFGIMLDLSRNAVLKTDTIRQMICYATSSGI
ncbi:MAG: hypothetical protein ACLSFA_20140 [Roseburia inulinivorans]